MKKLLNHTYFRYALFILLGLLIGWWLAPGTSTEADITPGTESSQAEVWTCSMHPQIRQAEPGDCPICGMDLILLANDMDDSDPLAIQMSPTAMMLADVRTTTIGAMDSQRTLRLNGKVQADERLTFSQSTHIPGRIERLLVSFTGEYVQKGQVLAQVYSPDLIVAQKELFEAQKLKEVQPQLFMAARAKLKNWKLSDAQIDDILKAGVPAEEFPIRSDVSGYVMVKKVELGDYINRGESIYEIADLSKVWVLFDVYEQDLAWIKKGDKVEVQIPSLAGKTIEGKVSFLDPIINPQTRVLKARVEVQNKGMELRPEMLASGLVKSNIPKAENALVVPTSAVLWTGERSVVYVRSSTDATSHFKMRKVLLGTSLGDSYVVLEGLEAGEEVVTSGAFSIDAAAQLAGKPSMMDPDGGAVMRGHDHGGTTSNSATSMDDLKQEKILQIDGEARKAVDGIFSKYFDLKNALVGDDFSDAVQSATAMQESIAAVDMKVFKGDAHVQWMSREKELSKSLEHVAHYGDIDALRDGFIGISNAIISTAQTFGTSDTSYVDYCPMAADNTGASWLSEQEKILNPYFGAKMLKCGSITNTIK